MQLLTITHGKRALFIKDVFKLWSISKDVGVLVGVLVQAVNTDHILKMLETVKWSQVQYGKFCVHCTFSKCVIR